MHELESTHAFACNGMEYILCYATVEFSKAVA